MLCFGHANVDALCSRTLAELRRMFTVATLIRVTKRLLQAKAEASNDCPKCGGQMAAADASPEFECGACQHTVAFPQGDDVLEADLLAIGARIQQQGSSLGHLGAHVSDGGP